MMFSRVSIEFGTICSHSPCPSTLVDNEAGDIGLQKLLPRSTTPTTPPLLALEEESLWSRISPSTVISVSAQRHARLRNPPRPDNCNSKIIQHIPPNQAQNGHFHITDLSPSTSHPIERLPHSPNPLQPSDNKVQCEKDSEHLLSSSRPDRFVQLDSISTTLVCEETPDIDMQELLSPADFLETYNVGYPLRPSEACSSLVGLGLGLSQDLFHNGRVEYLGSGTNSTALTTPLPIQNGYSLPSPYLDTTTTIFDLPSDFDYPAIVNKRELFTLAE